MNFKDYIDNLNNLDNCEARVELETFYTFNSSIFKFFKTINFTIEELLVQTNVSAKAKAQLEDILPILIKLRSEILSLEQYTFAIGYKEKVDVAIQYIKDKMVLNEVEDVAHKFYKLLEDNKSALLEAQKKKEDNYNLSPLQKAEKRFYTNGPRGCDLETLRILAEHSKDANLLETIVDTIDEYEKNITDPDDSIVAIIATNHNLKMRTLEFLVDNYEVTHFSIAQLSRVSSNILSKLANTKDVFVKSAVGLNIKTPIEILNKLANDDSYLVRLHVAKNTKSSLELLKKLSYDKDSLVSKAAKENPNYSELKGSTINTNVSTKSGCFIATACYGDYDAPEVIILRKYRDEHLLTNWLGSLFVRFYYAVSPSIARCLEKSDMVKSFIRNYFLRPIVRQIQCKYSNKN